MDPARSADASISSMLVLPDGTHRSIPPSGLTIGRLSGNDLVLEDPQISRRHAEIRYRDGAMHVKDLGSFNGTVVNGTRITGEGQLGDGDVIKLGDTLLTFRVRQRPGTPIEQRPVPAEPTAQRAHSSAVIPLSGADRPGVEQAAARGGGPRLGVSASEPVPAPGGASAQLRLAGVLDIETADLFRDQTRRLLDAGVVHFTLDLSDLEYVDSSGLGALVGLQREVKERAGSVCLQHLQSAVRDVIELTRLSRVFSIQ